jgi:hypothetical protein
MSNKAAKDLCVAGTSGRTSRLGQMMGPHSVDGYSGVGFAILAEPWRLLPPQSAWIPFCVSSRLLECTIEIANTYSMPRQVHDGSSEDAMLNFTNGEIRAINRCQLFLQVECLCRSQTRRYRLLVRCRKDCVNSFQSTLKPERLFADLTVSRINVLADHGATAAMISVQLTKSKALPLPCRYLRDNGCITSREIRTLRNELPGTSSLPSKRNDWSDRVYESIGWPAYRSASEL